MASGSRGRHTRVWVVLGLLLAVFYARPPQVAAAEDEFTVNITSPLGRTGIPGTIRIVARVRTVEDRSVTLARFYVDGAVVGEVSNGPPYAVAWVDENPFDPARIMVEAYDTLGERAADSVTLNPLELIEAAEVASVLLEASVEDFDGRSVTGLTKDHFVLTENDIEQPIDQMLVETVAATFTILVDRSQSMSRRINLVREAAAGLTGHLRPNDRIAIVPFGKEIGPVTGPTNDRQTVRDAISAIRATGGTAILDSVKQVATVLGDVKGRHAIVLITDGYDEHSSATLEEAVSALQDAHASLYVIGVGGVAGISLKGQHMLRELAAQGGGRAFFPAREFQLSNTHELVSSDVFHRYLITYTPLDQKPDGRWRAIGLSTSDPDLTIRTRDGYFAPEPPPVRPSIEFTITDFEQRLLEVSAEDLIVVEDGVEQAVDGFQEAVDPVSIVLALDSSGSMKKSAEAVMEAARTFVYAIRDEDSLAVLTFADNPVFAHDLTTTREWSLEAIDEYTPNGGTALYDTVVDALARLRRVEGRKVLVVLTDGRDEDNPGTGPGSLHTFAEALGRVHEIDAAVYAVGLGPNIDPQVIKQLATESGGAAYFPQDVSTLTEDYRRIVENLRRRYVISYTSTDPTRDGAWRDVDIRTRTPGTIVNSRGGYFAPEQ